MSMFFIVVCHGKYDGKDNSWDDGITSFSRPLHRTISEAKGFIRPDTSLNKAECPLVQEINRTDYNGNRQVTLLVKAMGYQQAEERARNFCDIWYRPRKVSKSKQLSRKEIIPETPKRQTREKAEMIFSALPRALARMKNLPGMGGFETEYIGKKDWRKDERPESGRTKQHVSREHKNR